MRTVVPWDNTLDMLVEDNMVEVVGKGLAVGDMFEDKILLAVGRSKLVEGKEHQHSIGSQRAAAQVRRDRRKGAERYYLSNV